LGTLTVLLPRCKVSKSSMKSRRIELRWWYSYRAAKFAGAFCCGALSAALLDASQRWLSEAGRAKVHSRSFLEMIARGRESGTVRAPRFASMELLAARFASIG
jgi:hypothetical protein